jgi:molecular chaperone DnaK (HSP70)
LIEVYVGERVLAKDNIKLGEFYITGIPPAPQGEH